MSLNDKRFKVEVIGVGWIWVYPEIDIEEAVKKERKLLQLVIDLEITWLDFLEKRDKIFGENLT